MLKKVPIISITIFLIDQIIKFIITANLNLYEEIIIIKDFFSLFYVQNFGAGFSILIGQRLFLILISLIALVAIIYYLYRNKDIKKYEKILYPVLIGGILGNLFDRIIFGYVIDYLSFNFFGYEYPVFNFADMAIVISIFGLLFFGIKDDFNENKGRRNREKNWCIFNW